MSHFNKDLEREVLVNKKLAEKIKSKKIIKEINEGSHTHSLLSSRILFSPDGKTIVAESDYSINVFSYENQRITELVSFGAGGLRLLSGSIEFSPDGNYLLVISNYQVIIFDLKKIKKPPYYTDIFQHHIPMTNVLIQKSSERYDAFIMSIT